jgi:hypothetical protein
MFLICQPLSFPARLLPSLLAFQPPAFQASQRLFIEMCELGFADGVDIEADFKKVLMIEDVAAVE